MSTTNQTSQSTHHHNSHEAHSSNNSESSAEHDHSGHDHHDHHAHMVADFKRRFWISVILTLPVLVLSPLIQQFLNLTRTIQFPGDQWILFGFSTAVFFYGGWPFLKGLYDELSDKNPGMMTLIGVAITTAYAYSTAVVFGVSGKVFFWETVTLIDIMLLGHWIEMRSVMGASRALEKLAELMPQTAHKLQENGDTKDVPLDELEADDRVLIKPGEKIPADGIIVDGKSAVNESMLTGESEPVTKGPDDDVIGGAINGDGSLTVTVKKTGDDSYLSQMINLVEEARAGRSKTQDLANRAALWLTVIALSAGFITMLVWLLVVGQDFVFALERTVTVMVITCPHALGLAVPLVVAVSTTLAAKNGFLIRDRSAFERSRKLQAMIFDKTGTLTKGEFGVAHVISLHDDVDEDTVLRQAAAVESHSEHPIAQGIADAAHDPPKVDDFQSLPGQGVQGQVDGKTIKVVSRGYIQQNDMEMTNDAVENAFEEGQTVVFVVADDTVIGAIALSDMVRDESGEAIKKLKERGIQCMMLTGDNEKVARRVAEELGLDDYFAEVLPDAKADKVKDVQSRDLVTAMVGDGVNDAPALAQADVGIAIGAGTDVAVETADIVLVRDNPLDSLALIQLADATHRKMIQNLFWATGYNAFAIPLAAGVLAGVGILLSPAVGAVLMSLSTVIVAINAKLLDFDNA